MTPRTQTVLIGHTSVEQTILRSWQRGCLHHAMIFVGPKGVGKATCAFRLARFLLSPERENDQLGISATSPVFCRIASGGHGDLLVIEPNPELASKEINIDRVRPIRRFLSQTSMEGGWRIVIIDGAMNRNAANALLKSLEEPPKNTLIIIIADALGNLSPTIRSRCIQYAFSPIDATEAKSVIQTLYPELDKEQLNGVIALCGGRPGYVTTLKESNAVSLYQHLLESLVSLKASSLETVIPFCQKYSAKPKKSETVDSWWLVGELFAMIMQRLILAAREQLVLPVYPAEREHLGALLTWRSLPEWAVVLGKVTQSYAAGRISHLDRFQVLLGAMASVS
ncbi:MAG: hypothetical protein ABFQ95_06635 [Pseudomonadota bacterium]